MGRGLVEDHQVAGFHGQMMEDLPVVLEVPDGSGHGEMGLVTARNYGQPAVFRIHVGQVELADDQAAPHASVVVHVVGGPGEHPRAVSVEWRALGARLRGEHVDIVVQFPSPAHHGIEIGNQLRVGEQAAEGLAPGLIPGQHTLVVDVLRVGSRQRGAVQRTARSVLAGPVGMGVQGVVQRSHFIGRKQVAHHEKPLQVIEVFLALAHYGEVFRVAEHGHGGLLAACSA